MPDEFFRNSERRREERIPARIEIHFSKPKDAAKAFKAYSVNFSPGGLCVRMKSERPIGDRLSIRLVVGGEEFDLEAVVAWTRGTVTGMRFDGLSADDRSRLERLAEVLRVRPAAELEEDVEV
jgi:hypothetical protein